MSAAMQEGKQPMSPAERMAQMRRRKRDGLRVLSIELRAAEIEALVQRGLLDRADIADLDAVGEALYAFLDANLLVTA